MLSATRIPDWNGLGRACYWCHHAVVVVNVQRSLPPRLPIATTGLRVTGVVVSSG